MSEKSQIVRTIAGRLGVEAPALSVGSGEPKLILQLVNQTLGLGFDNKLPKPALARSIVEASGARWTPDCESRGNRVTTEGLKRVDQAVRFFLSE